MKLERTWEVSKLLTILQPIPRLSLGVWDEGRGSGFREGGNRKPALR